MTLYVTCPSGGILLTVLVAEAHIDSVIICKKYVKKSTLDNPIWIIYLINFYLRDPLSDGGAVSVDPTHPHTSKQLK